MREDMTQIRLGVTYDSRQKHSRRSWHGSRGQGSLLMDCMDYELGMHNSAGQRRVATCGWRHGKATCKRARKARQSPIHGVNFELSLLPTEISELNQN